MWKQWSNKLKGHKLLVGLVMAAQLVWQGSKVVGQIADVKLLIDIIFEYSVPILQAIFSPLGAIITFVGGFLYLIWDTRESRKQTTGVERKQPASVDASGFRRIEKESFQKELRDAAERNRQALSSNQFVVPASVPLQPLPSPAPLFGVQIKPMSLPDQRALILVIENTSNKPIRCEILIEKEQHWSEKQKEFVNYSYSLNRVTLQSDRILEPDRTTQIPLVRETESQGKNFLAVSSVFPYQIPVPDPGIHLIRLQVKSKNGDKSEDLFVRWIPKQILEVVEDPRKKV
jgi:hypothetical protein